MNQSETIDRTIKQHVAKLEANYYLIKAYLMQIAFLLEPILKTQ